MSDNTIDDDTRQQAHDAYMKHAGVSCEVACEMVDIMLDPDPTRFLQGLAEWASAFDARLQGNPSK